MANPGDSTAMKQFLHHAATQPSHHNRRAGHDNNHQYNQQPGRPTSDHPTIINTIDNTGVPRATASQPSCQCQSVSSGEYDSAYLEEHEHLLDSSGKNAQFAGHNQFGSGFFNGAIGQILPRCAESGGAGHGPDSFIYFSHGALLTGSFDPSEIW